jgi:hypothetical protein
VRIRKKLGMWAVINPPSAIKYFKTEKEALEYKELMTAEPEKEEREDGEVDYFNPMYMEK